MFGYAFAAAVPVIASAIGWWLARDNGPYPGAPRRTTRSFR